jgi:signal transduction histidine kinase
MPRRDRQEDHPALLSTAPPSPYQKRLAACVSASLLLAMLLAAPFAGTPLTNTEFILPAYAAAVLVSEIITASLLLGLFSVQRSWAVLALAAGYLFSGALVVPWVLTFPGVLAQLGLPDAGTQATASIAALRRIGFPLLLLIYALLKDRKPSIRSFAWPLRSILLGCVAGTLMAAAGLTWLIVTNDQALPRFMLDSRNVSDIWNYIPIAAVVLYLTTMGVLWSRLRSVLDLWLLVVLWTLLIEILLISFISSGVRLSIGWWAGRLFGFASASVVLLVLLAETISLSVRLAHSVAAERRTREARLLAMQALSASIAHEINQPLASMVMNADAGLRWLSRPLPGLEEASAALNRIVRDGHRAGKVIEGIRTMFMKGTQERVPLNLNRLIGEVISRSEQEIRLRQTAIRLELDDDLPTVSGNPVQLQQVISNLIDNAVDAMGAVSSRARMLRIRSQLQQPEGILVAVEDSGPGLQDTYKEQVFEAFFSTKAEGMGMGLMFCRSVIEAHGGRLWVTDNKPCGAIFQFTLPCADENTSSVAEQIQ